MSARSASLLAAIVAVLTAASSALAQPATRVVVAKSNSPASTFSARPANGNQFATLPDKDDLYAGDLLVSLPGGALVSKNGAVSVKLLADYDARSPLPILETALSLGDAKDTDLELTLDRGRVDIANAKDKGAATVVVRFWDQTWKVVLDSPGSRVAVEICGRWPSGTRFKLAEPDADTAKAPAPVASLVFLVLRGTASVDVGGVTLAV